MGVHAACTWRVGMIDDMDGCIAPAWVQAHVASGCQLVKVGAARVRSCISWAEIDQPAGEVRIRAPIAFVCAVQPM